MALREWGRREVPVRRDVGERRTGHGLGAFGELLALGRSAGNRAVAGMLSPVIQRSPDTDVIAALDDKMRYLRPNGDVKKAWGVLNALSMTDMLNTMSRLEVIGRLAVMTGDLKAASSFNVPRLTVGFTAVRLKLSGKVDDPAELGKLAGLVGSIGSQVGEVESFLRLPPSTLADPRANVTEPDPAKLGDIRSALEPASAGVGGAPPVGWDGAGPGATAAGNRAALKKALLAGLAAHLKGVMPRMRKLKKGPKLPMTAFEGAGKEAKRSVDSVLAPSTTAAALTAGQSAARTSFNFAAGTNLVDLTDRANYTPNPEDVTSWMVETDPATARAAAAHHFERTRSPAEQSFLDAEVINPFVSAHKTELELYDVLGFAITLDGKVAIQPHLTGDTKTPKGGGPSPAERAARWSEWETLVHEYIHTLEHPAFGQASKGRRVMKEGFCELFTKEVLSNQIPLAKAGDPALQKGVEGVDPSGNPWPGFTSALVPAYNAGSYASYLANAEKVVGATSMAAARSAFFQGHVELIGLAPDGSMASPVALGTGELIAVPAGVTTVFSLAVITGSSTAAIVGANPGMKAADPLPANVRVPGVRTHTLVVAEEFRPTGGAMASKVEGPTEIAAQHGLDPVAISRANPGFDWSKAKGGDRVIVPAH